MDWLGQVEYVKSMNEEYRKDAKEFCQRMTDEGLRPTIVKGLACARFYPKPELRSLGDLDVYFAKDGKSVYQLADEAAARIGADVQEHDYKHTHIHWKSVNIENHRLLTTARGQKAKKEFEKELQRLLCKEQLGVEWYRYPSAQFDALFLMVHAFQHFLIEGLTLRQVCDWAMFLKGVMSGSNGSESSKGDDVLDGPVDWEAFYKWMDALKITRFANAMNYIALECLLGMGACSEIRTDKALGDRILEDVLIAENRCDFGNNHGVKYHWMQLKNYWKNNWKFREVYGTNAIVEYAKTLWYYYEERTPEV